MSFVSSLVGGIMGSGAANEAATVEAQAGRDASAKIENKAQGSLDYQNQILKNTTAAEQPYQTLGSTSANHLRDLISGGFHAPTLAEAEATPGFKFRQEQGTRGIAENAAANGTLFSGNTGVALSNYNQNLAESAYGEDYSRALNTYMANYQSMLGGTGVGLSSTGQIAAAGQNAADLTANVNTHAGDAEAQQIQNIANARASGYMGSAKAWSGAAGGMAAGLADFAGGIAGGIGNLDATGGSSFGEQLANFGRGYAGA